MAATGPASDGADASLEVELREDAGRFVAAAAPDNAYLEFVMEQDGAVMNMTHTWTAPPRERLPARSRCLRSSTVAPTTSGCGRPAHIYPAAF